MRFTVREIATAVHGVVAGLASGGDLDDIDVARVVIDSRDVAPGDLFVAVVADRDGHRFIDAARSSGAVAWMTSVPDERRGAIVVDNTLAGLQRLGGVARERIVGGVVGITGSSGKTSTKDLASSILEERGPIARSERSFNNELGVPLTLVNAPDTAWAGVVEMGARGVGHIAELCSIARPTVGVITNIGLAHREMFGSAEATADAKGELIESLPPSGTAVLNIDDAMFERLRRRGACRVLTFSSSGAPAADLRASPVRLDTLLHPSFRMETPWGSFDVQLGVSGAHQVENALAAAGASMALGASTSNVQVGLASATASPLRMDLSSLASGAFLLNDSYNANPASMAAAFDALTALDVERRIAVVGTMAELGPDSAAEHRAIVEKARTQMITLIVVDEPDYGPVPVAGIDGAMAALSQIGSPRAGDAILVKASRVAGLERLADALTRGASKP